MRKPGEHLHVVFGLSPAGLLRRALFSAGRSERVFGFGEDLSFGPIASENALARADWMEQATGWPDWIDVIEDTRAIVGACVAAERQVVAWFAPDSASSIAGYLWWLSQIGDVPVRTNKIPRIGQLHPDILQGYLDKHAELTAVERTDAVARWQTLRKENAPLRIVSGSGLVSAAIDHFDEMLIPHVPADWRKMSWIVGMALSASIDEGGDQTGDLVLLSRLRTLARNGTIEWRGDLDDFRGCEVRLPAARSRGAVGHT